MGKIGFVRFITNDEYKARKKARKVSKNSRRKNR